MKTEILNSKMVKCYDNGGKSIDRYTVVYLDESEQKGVFNARGMSAYPFHGIGTMCSAMVGSHLGKRIKFTDLPKDCQRVVDCDTGFNALIRNSN